MRTVTCEKCGTTAEYKSRGYPRKFCAVCRPKVARKSKDITVELVE